jgi:hypothetical protein
MASAKAAKAAECSCQLRASMKTICRLFAVSHCLLVGGISLAAMDLLAPAGAVWKYLDDGSDQGTAWITPSFDDSAWASGPAKLGYGTGDESTVVSFGPDPSNKYITTYFRHAFDLEDPSIFNSATLHLLRDDGAVVYLNGEEIIRSNMPGGTINYLTRASSTISGSAEKIFHMFPVDPTRLLPGLNVLAVSIHQVNATSSDISFNLDLAASTENRLLRGPYLQLGTPTSTIIRWRTAGPAISAVRYGYSPGFLDQVSENLETTTEHEVLLAGLEPDTRYYYAVGDGERDLAGGPTFYFVTSPSHGAPKPSRIWVLGDSGTADQNAARVRNAYLGYAGEDRADLTLMLGDNAYNDGTDAEYQRAMFDMYPEILRNTVFWSTLGNHDGHTASSATQTGPYFEIFNLPREGEAGGLASGTEAYYSFDYANIHFICLDSYHSDRSPSGPMLTWLRNDLESTSQEWIIAFWHHPPYSKGSHNSDTEGRMIQMRENVLPILEAAGVDLVLTGHSHSYERSFLIDGHYGSSQTFSQEHLKDGGDGRVDGDGAYVKPPGLTPRAGAVYTVAGSSGKISGGSLNHPAKIVSLNVLGSMILDVAGDQLNAMFIDDQGAIRDYFTISKSTAQENPPEAPDALLALPISHEAIALSWRDNSQNETGFIIERSEDGQNFSHLAAVGANVEDGIDAPLAPETTYFYRVAAFNEAGMSLFSNVAEATTEPLAQFHHYFAQGEQALSGTVTGTYEWTWDDQLHQTITEVESKGKRENRFSLLEHKWFFPIQPAPSITFFAHAFSTVSADGDEFIFQYSMDDLIYHEMFRITGPESQGFFQSFSLPSNLSGTFYVRVIDSQREPGGLFLDSLHVSQMFLRLINEASSTPPAAPSELTAQTLSSSSILLTWQDNSIDEQGFVLETSPDGTFWEVAAFLPSNSIQWADNELAPDTWRFYRLKAFNEYGESDYSNIASAVTLAETSIQLSAAGFKLKGSLIVDLAWSGADGNSVRLFRNGEHIANPPNNGSYTDSTGLKGSGTFTYLICESEEDSPCSNTVEVVF